MDRLEHRILDIIDDRRDEIVAFGNDIWAHGELGFKEHRTASQFANYLKTLGINTEESLAVTGVKGYLNGKGTHGITVALMGEMDALPVAGQNENKVTSAVHCCGHNAQIAGVAGAAFALTDPKIREAMYGNVIFFGVPAEEYVDIEYREQMIREGLILFGSGKPELIRIGAMNDVDMVIGHHMMPETVAGLFNCSFNGLVNKIVRYSGRSAHAANAPQEGINALNAAAIMMHAIDVQRETFRDQDTVRIHGYISNGGTAMNVIADTVTMEYSVRAKNNAAMQDASQKFDRAVRAGAIALGCSADIDTIPGYLPLIPAKDTILMESAIAEAAGSYKITHITADTHMTGSTDYGELSHVYPLIQFTTGGFSGYLHNPNLEVSDEYLAYVLPAKIFALSAYKYLKDGASGAKNFINNYHQAMTKEELIEYLKNMRKKETVVNTPLPVLK